MERLTEYEIIAGHNRVRCARELGHTTIKADIIECDDDKATLIMLDTNLCQRDEIPPVEKGYAYKMQLETIKKIGVQCEHLKSIDELSEKLNVKIRLSGNDGAGFISAMLGIE